jgi:dolichyl-phosphate-mannose--protein O-mannosyl transferase
LIFFALALFSSAGFDWSASGMKYSGNGILADEIPHISGGYYYLKTNRYFINPEHPPLVKDIAGLGIMLFSNPKPAFPNITEQVGLPSDYQRPSYPFEHTNFPKILEWQNNQINFGKLFLFHPQNNPDGIAFYARLAVIFVNTLLLYFLFFLLAKIWSERAALLGLFFFAVSQFSIAHGSFVVIDFMSAVLTVIAIVCFAIYLKNYIEKKNTTGYLLLTSLFFALALLSKFSSIVLLPAAFISGLIFVILMEIQSPRSKGDRISVIIKYIFSYAAIVVLALFIISIFYVFHTYKMENEMLVQKIYENYPEEQLPAVGHEILRQMIYLNPLAKGLAGYINGSFMVVSRMMTSTQNTYFLGNVYGSEGAGGWYFPVLYATKLSLGLHFFSLLVLSSIIYRFFKSKKR